MVEAHVYCCQRCGIIFEAEGTRNFCDSCQKALSASGARVVVYTHTCKSCLRKFDDRASQSKYCPKCKDIVASRQRNSWKAEYYKKPMPERKTVHKSKDIAQIAKEAREKGMSYGRYVAKYGIK